MCMLYDMSLILTMMSFPTLFEHYDVTICTDEFIFIFEIHDVVFIKHWHLSSSQGCENLRSFTLINLGMFYGSF